jgi:4a-hydroxytetrahydrobiopterin dehydratase
MNDTAEKLRELPGWALSNNKLWKTFSFNDYAEAMEFANAVARIAHKLDHHPDMLVQYGRVTLTTSTHDAGNKVTQKDFKLAAEVEAIE